MSRRPRLERLRFEILSQRRQKGLLAVTGRDIADGVTVHPKD